MFAFLLVSILCTSKLSFGHLTLGLLCLRQTVFAAVTLKLLLSDWLPLVNRSWLELLRGPYKGIPSL